MSAVGGQHARHRLDDAIASPVRLSLVAALAQVDEAEFAHVRDAIEVTDSTLSRHAAQLEEVGYVKIRKGHVGKRPRTWLSLTSTGRAAFATHVAALRAIADGLPTRTSTSVEPTRRETTGDVPARVLATHRGSPAGWRS